MSTLFTAAWAWFVTLAGIALAGGVAYTCWAYRRSRRMKHVLPLSASYLLLVAGSVVSYLYPEWRLASRVDESALATDYGLGAWGLSRLIYTGYGGAP